ncbi:MAG: prephenate dehydrogenase [Candidatus Latescibacteria bacterium]|nr:prephenate dehydrogenase [Candidatus Latescibacterota bacterium]
MPDRPTVAIVGVGLIGGSLGLAWKRRETVGRVIGISRPSTIDQAVSLRVIDDGGDYTDIPEKIPQADVVILSTPIGRALELLPVIASVAKPGAIVTDVGSTKADICRQANAVLPDTVVFIGGHPMAGSEQHGVSAGDPYLFENAIYALTPSQNTPENKLSVLNGLVSELGARVLVIDPDAHDRIVAAVSHLPQLLAVALVEMAGGLNAETPEHLIMAAGGFRDMTRIASSPFEMWRDICSTNGGPIDEVLALFSAQMDKIRGSLETGDLEAHFKSAAAIRAEIPSDTRGVISEVQDILVHCQDSPGQLAGITAALFAADINIKDIELLKIREGEGGTFRVSVESQTEAARAAQILSDAGFPSRRR